MLTFRENGSTVSATIQGRDLLVADMGLLLSFIELSEHETGVCKWVLSPAMRAALQRAVTGYIRWIVKSEGALTP